MICRFCGKQINSTDLCNNCMQSHPIIFEYKSYQGNRVISKIAKRHSDNSENSKDILEGEETINTSDSITVDDKLPKDEIINVPEATIDNSALTIDIQETSNMVTHDLSIKDVQTSSSVKINELEIQTSKLEGEETINTSDSITVDDKLPKDEIINVPEATIDNSASTIDIQETSNMVTHDSSIKDVQTSPSVKTNELETQTPKLEGEASNKIQEQSFVFHTNENEIKDANISKLIRKIASKSIYTINKVKEGKYFLLGVGFVLGVGFALICIITIVCILNTDTKYTRSKEVMESGKNMRESTTSVTYFDDNNKVTSSIPTSSLSTIQTTTSTKSNEITNYAAEDITGTYYRISDSVHQNNSEDLFLNVFSYKPDCFNKTIELKEDYIIYDFNNYYFDIVKSVIQFRNVSFQNIGLEFIDVFNFNAITQSESFDNHDKFNNEMYVFRFTDIKTNSVVLCNKLDGLMFTDMDYSSEFNYEILLSISNGNKDSICIVRDSNGNTSLKSSYRSQLSDIQNSSAQILKKDYMNKYDLILITIDDKKYYILKNKNETNVYMIQYIKYESNKIGIQDGILRNNED